MRSLFVFAAACLLLVLSGCSGQPTSPDRSDSVPTILHQVPAEVQKLIDDFAPADDGTPPRSKVTYLDPIPSELTDNCDLFCVTFLWGDLFSDSFSPDTTDWSGTLWVNGEAVVHVRYMIDFEPGQDSVLIHNNPSFAAWLSYTSADFDGLNFLVFLKRDIVYITPPVLTFETAPITLEFDFQQLIKLDAYYQVDNSSGVAVHARKIWPNACQSGSMEGRWIKETNDQSQGYFHGFWKDRWGTPIGYMSGIFWMDDDGMGQFIGSVSGLVTDQVIAEFKGVWFFDDPRLCPICGDDHGFFIGKYTYIEGGTGRMKGEFGYPPSPDMTDLPYYGIWHDDCLYDSQNDVNSAAD
jgi:hypothetical protein